MSLVKTPVNSTAESFKPGIPKNDRKIDITFDFLTLQEGPHGCGWTESGIQLFEATDELISAINSAVIEYRIICFVHNGPEFHLSIPNICEKFFWRVYILIHFVYIFIGSV